MVNVKTLKEMIHERIVSLDVYKDPKLTEYLVKVIDELITTYKYNMGADERNKLLVREAFDLVNLSGNDRRLSEEFIKHIQTEHRTLIQSFFRMIQKVIEGYSKHTSSDARNVGSLKWAKDISKIDGYFPLI